MPNVTLHRRRTVREPAARQVRKQLACSGFAVRWKRLLALLSHHLSKLFQRKQMSNFHRNMNRKVAIGRLEVRQADL
jgi:hypothetical protein